MTQVLELESMPDFVFQDWAKLKMLVPLKLWDPVAAAAAASVAAGTTPPPRSLAHRLIGVVMHNWVADGVKRTADGALSLAKWALGIKEVGDSEVPTAMEAMKEVAAMEAGRSPRAGLSENAAELAEGIDTAVVFVPAITALGARVVAKIVTARPMIDTVMTLEEWTVFLHSEHVIHARLLTEYLMATSGMLYALETECGGGVYFSTSTAGGKETDSAIEVLYFKQLFDLMVTTVRAWEEELDDIQRFGGSSSTRKEELQRLLDLNKLFAIQLAKTMARMRKLVGVSLVELGCIVEEDCLTHFPGRWPRRSEDAVK